MKRLALSIIFFLFANISYASDNTPRFFVLNDFSGGLNSHISEYNIPNNQATDLQNVRFNDNYSELSKRDILRTEIDFGTGPITSLYRYYTNTYGSFTIAALGTYLKADDEGSVITLRSGLTDGRRWGFVTYKDKLIGGNGSDNLIKWDGYTQVTENTDNSRTSGDLCAELGAPFAQLSSENGGNDLDAESWYVYKIAFYDGSTYSYSTAKSNPIKTGTAVTNTQNITLTDIPLGPEGTTHRYVYRTLGNANRAAAVADNTYYRIADIADNSTMTYNDAMTDATASGDSAPSWATASAGINATPPISKFFEIYSERLFTAGNPTYPSDIYWSDQFNPDYFDSSDFQQVRPDDGGQVSFIKVFLGILRIGKTNCIQSAQSNPITNSDGSTTFAISVTDPMSFVGCPAPYSVAVSPKGIVYLGRDGLYLFSGQYSSLISDAVTSQITDIAQTNISETYGYFWNNEYRLAYSSTETGSLTNDRVLIYDFTRNAYTIDTENINCFASFGTGDDLGTLYSGTSTSDGYVIAHQDSERILSKRNSTDFDYGAYDDTRAYDDDENNQSYVKIGWDCTISGWLTELQTKDASINTIEDIGTYLPNATIEAPDTDGNWISPVYQINAQELDRIFWNENLGSSGDVTFQIRTGATSGACQAASWSAEFTNPNGSDISAVTASVYIQVKINFSTDDIQYIPYLYRGNGYIFKLLYYKVGTPYETSVLSEYETGWKDFGVTGYLKKINRIRIFYKGESGTLNVNYKNDLGDVNKSFLIDLSVLPSLSTTDQYSGDEENKVYTFYPPMNSADDPSAIGNFFKFTITENGTKMWSISKVEVQYGIEEIY